MTSQSQSSGGEYLDCKSILVASEFGTTTEDFRIADLSKFEYLPAMNRIAMSLGLDQTAGSPNLAASVSPSLSPSHVPCIEDTTGATSLVHLSNCESFQDTMGQWRWTTSTGCSEWRRIRALRADLP